MCTSFISRGQNDTIIGMNFDNNGMKYAINTGKPELFAVYVDGGRGKHLSFGVDSSGTFINNLVVDSNGKGLYRRPSKKVTHTSKLVSDILNRELPAENLGAYLERVEVVNTPDWSCHNMICDPKANVRIVEPGRGNIFRPADSSPYFVMTNFSLWDYLYENTACNCTRYKTVSDALSRSAGIDVDAAFDILESAKQSDGEWVTALSMVYSRNARAVYYCLDGHFNERVEYKFPR